MNPTEKLYDLDAYNVHFNANIVSCKTCDDGKLAVILDKTLFFPEEGGQTPDTGTIKISDTTYTVTEVQIDKNNVITHYLYGSDGSISTIAPGTEVTGDIDWGHRYSNMQNHTGEHIFSGLVCSKKNCHNVGFHLSDDIVTMDYDTTFTDSEIKEFELAANKVIMDNLTVNCAYPSAEELKSINYRSKIEIEGPVRIVTIPGVDTCACCAPHVRKTGEIGLLKVISSMNYKGGTRFSILCGKRAVNDYMKKHEILVTISRTLSESPDKTAEAVAKLLNEKNDTAFKLRQAEGELLSLRAEMIPSSEKNVILFAKEGDVNETRKVINSLTAKRGGYCAVFTGDDENGYSFITGSSDRDCNELAKNIREKFGGKCGGDRKSVV